VSTRHALQRKGRRTKGPREPKVERLPTWHPHWTRTNTGYWTVLYDRAGVRRRVSAGPRSAETEAWAIVDAYRDEDDLWRGENEVLPTLRRAPAGPGVYFLQEAGPHALIKLGFSSNVPARARQLQGTNRVDLRLLAVIPGGTRDLEGELHRRFWYARRRGEWFRPVGKLLAYIASLQKGGWPC
jgi:hypothetical protein